MILLSDLFDPRGFRGGLEELLRRNHELLVIHILDEGDIRLDSWGDVALLDVETARERRLFLDGVLAQRFGEEIQRYFEEAASFCLTRGVDYLRTTTATPFEDFVLLALRQGRTFR